MRARLETLRPDRLAFAIIAGIAAGVILIAARDAVFTGDEWGMLLRLTQDPLPTALFDAPPGKYLIAVPMLIYGAIAELLGADSYLPYRILGVALLILAAGLFFALARRRVGAIALPCAVLLLFLGAAWDVVVIPGRVPSQVALCAGLGMLLALDRRDARGDAVACGCGTVAILSHPIGLAFLVAAAPIVCLGRTRGWTRSWVFLIPLAVYGLWSLTLSEPVETDVPTTLGDDLSFAWDTFVALCATVAGVFRPPWADGVDFAGVAAHAVALLAIAGCAVAIARARRISVWLAATLAALAFDLLAPALTGGGFLFRTPDAPRYLYPGAIFLLLVLVEVAALARLPRRATIVAGAAGVLVFAFSLAANLNELLSRADGYGQVSRVQVAEFGAFELAREGRSPAEVADDLDATLDESEAALYFILGAPEPAAVARAAPAYFLVADRFGAPADSAAEIEVAPLATRQQVDRVLAEAVPIRLQPGRSTGSRTAQRCMRVAASSESAESAAFAAPPGSLVITAAPGPPPKVGLGRFSGAPVAPLGWPQRSPSHASLVLPETGLAGKPWLARVDRAAAITYCGDAAGGG